MDSSAEMTSSAVTGVEEDLAVESAHPFEGVSFIDTQSVYPPSEDLEVRFTVGEAVETSSRDWVGLYKVGWTAAKDYYTFEWAPAASGETRNCTVVFQARRLPRDEHSSFQFCYVTKSSDVRGVSAPFQIKSYVDDDLECIEVQDDNLESLVLVNSRAAENRLDQYREQNALLESTVQRTKAEYSVLQEQLDEAERGVAMLNEEKMSTAKLLEEACQTVSELRRQECDSAASQAELNDRLARKEKQLLHLQAELENTTKSAVDLREELKRMAAVAEQAEEEHRAALEQVQAATQAMQETQAVLNAQLEEQERQIQSAEVTSSSLQEECKKQTALFEEKCRDLSAAEVHIEQLEQEVAAVQKCNEELTVKLKEVQIELVEKETVAEAQREAADSKVESARMEVQSLQEERSALQVQLDLVQEQLSAMELAQESSSSDVAQCNIIELVGERSALQDELKLTHARVAQLEEEASKPKSVDDGALFALQHAFRHAEQQRDELTRERDTLRQQLRVQRAQQAAVQSLEAEAVELRSKCQDLERRLELGAEEYRKKFREWHTCNKQLEQMKEKQSRSDKPEETQVEELEERLSSTLAEVSLR